MKGALLFKKGNGPFRQFERQWLWMWSLRVNPWCKTHDVYPTDGETTFRKAGKFATLQGNVHFPVKTIMWVLFHKATAIVNQRGISFALRLAWSRKLSPVTRGTYLDGLPKSNTLCSNIFFSKTTSATADFSVMCNVSLFILVILFI